MAELSEDDRDAAWADVLDCLGQFEGATGFDAEFEVIIASGEKSYQ